jgi:two-component system, OmpR family, response regulator
LIQIKLSSNLTANYQVGCAIGERGKNQRNELRLLLAEDDERLSTRLRADLVRAGYAVDVADNGVDAEHLGAVEPYDAVVLDLGLPQRPGLELLRHWRAANNKVPVIILTARDAWHEKVDGFKAGADDYLTKPFHTEELLARIGALIRRNHAEPGGVLHANGATLDEARRALVKDGQLIELTGVEFRLLRYFMLHPGQVLSKSELIRHVYDNDSDKDSNVIEVYVRHLRKKLGGDWISTRRGQGYVFVRRHAR